VESSLHNPIIIAAMAHARVDRGAGGVRIDSPAHLKANPSTLARYTNDCDSGNAIIATVLYTLLPNIKMLLAVADAGADMIALDATPESAPMMKI
jgi:N-acylglucosamine-6-phosphate 2-epimerase